MDTKVLAEKAEAHLKVLCSTIGERRVGGEANRKSTKYVSDCLRSMGWNVESTELKVIDWQTEGASLFCNGESFEVFSSYYSLGCSVEGEMVAIDTVTKLEKTSIKGKVVFLYGDIASQQIAPKKFPFWNPEEHQHFISVLETGQPLALICATARNAATAGGVYPFPLFEDGDFDIPSVFMKDTEGLKLLKHDGQVVRVISKAKRIPETAFNILAFNKVDLLAKRVVVSAHIDSKNGTPGAIDNATGVTVLLLLAELLKNNPAKHNVELAFFNGEDYYAASGQVKYMEQNKGHFNDIVLNINVDGAGYKDGLSCFSPMGLSEVNMKVLREVLDCSPQLIQGEPWYQGDHSMFLQQGCEAIAVSSQWFVENIESQDVTHTPKDNISIVNFSCVAECAQGIANIISML